MLVSKTIDLSKKSIEKEFAKRRLTCQRPLNVCFLFLGRTNFLLCPLLWQIQHSSGTAHGIYRFLLGPWNDKDAGGHPVKRPEKPRLKSPITLHAFQLRLNTHNKFLSKCCIKQAPRPQLTRV